MPLGQLCGTVRHLSPGAHHQEGAVRWPHGISEIAEGVAQTVFLRLVALWDRVGDAPEDGEPVIEIVAQVEGQALQSRRNFAAGEPGVAAPGYDVVEEDITMNDKDRAAPQFEIVMRGEIRVVVSSDKRGAADLAPEKARDGGAAVLGVGGVRPGPSVEGVAVQHDMGHALEQGPDLF